MRIYALVFLAASPAFAGDGTCDELWFTRNAIFHGAGYCFSSPLGQALFGNEGCTTKSPELTAAQSARLDRVKAAEEGCVIDPSRTSLDIPDLAIRRRLTVLPIRSESESGCIGWKGGPLSLRTGTSHSAETLFTLEPDDVVLFSHESEQAGGEVWDYVQVYDNGVFRKAGWAVIDWGPEVCEGLAG
ncbi:DUF4453 domain-containing protein [Vannielia litorea]|uniref:DUF4453 domain-containing protein n=1 Tax=Vannielia litorea TaxID=1217970 RepID=UPI001C945DD3|nr:DUF4453 domain-containing protein [Vannielia litorea]MBY6155627.1 DUF4453 domain-containing protein [Vannielia litorea]